MTEDDDAGVVRGTMIHAKPRREVWSGYLVIVLWLRAVFTAAAHRSREFGFRAADQRVPMREHVFGTLPRWMKARVHEDDIWPNPHQGPKR
jgi:hypothetical protein